MSDQARKFWKRLTADRRQFYVLCSLAALGLLLWGRLMLQKVPRTAVADPPAQSAKAEQPTKPGQPNATDEAETPVEPPLERIEIEIEPPAAPTRDLFVFEPTLFRPIKVEDQTNTQTQPKTVDPSPDRHQLEAELRQRLGELQLQTTVFFNGEPRAMINGKIRKIGDTVRGFKVTKIEQRSVVLEALGIESTLSLDEKQ